ncbi:pyridoxal 5'-phosphate synthase glutaminase subunit PdxT [bacterium CPR1]|nr:pyridoxal 5'-phosphate synthase glutaminase subunit PdxT [bacterium CPR1]
MVTIGVLALQGAVEEHLAALAGAGCRSREVRCVADLTGLDGLILPGGESTTIGKLLDRYELLEPIRQRAGAGMGVWGTCAGMILLSREVRNALPGQPVLGLMDTVVERNAYGRQVDSFSTELSVACLGPEPVPAVFIRAPRIAECGPEVEVLARFQGEVVAARQGRLLATSFHPELTGDRRWHSYFAQLCGQPVALAC